jgi:pimeloyl-ACP methyl ester carboxylesterase
MSNTLITFLTPQKIQLHGVWLGGDKAKTVFVFLHGLGGSLFSRAPLLELLAAEKDTAVLTFNNRGYGLINSFKRKKKKNETEYYIAGMAHELFSECLDDIDGALSYARSRGAKRIFLVGHSTGCQKSIYYLAKKTRVQIAGAILLAPVSDYAAINLKDRNYIKALRKAEQLKKAGKGQSLLPANLWSHAISAQRFLSLYTPSSEEEIFSYASKGRPKLLQKVTKPILAVLAELDEFNDRPIKEMKNWFDETLKTKSKYSSVIVKEATHSFAEKEREVLRVIKRWVNKK